MYMATDLMHFRQHRILIIKRKKAHEVNSDIHSAFWPGDTFLMVAQETEIKQNGSLTKLRRQRSEFWALDIPKFSEQETRRELNFVCVRWEVERIEICMEVHSGSLTKGWTVYARPSRVAAKRLRVEWRYQRLLCAGKH